MLGNKNLSKTLLVCASMTPVFQAAGVVGVHFFKENQMRKGKNLAIDKSKEDGLTNHDMILFAIKRVIALKAFQEESDNPTWIAMLQKDIDRWESFIRDEVRQ